MTVLTLPIWQVPTRSNPIHLTDNTSHIWRFVFSSTVNLEKYWDILTIEEKQRAERFYFTKDRNAYLCARGALRSILSHYLGITASAIRLNYTAYGKPFIDPEQNTPGLHFNISHSHDCMLYACAKHSEIGIDIEYLKPKLDYLDIARSFFSRYEYQQLVNIHPQQQNQAFYKIWTCKEAFIKAIGQGLSYSLTDFDVEIPEDQPVKILTIKNSPAEVKQWTLLSFAPAEKYIAAIAIKQRLKQIDYYLYPSHL